MNQTIYLASDYDGTFKQGSIRDEDKEAIQRFRSRGNRFGLVTGRSLSMLEQEFARYDMHMDFIIACTGAVIFDQDLNVIFKKPMDTATAWELEAEMERRPAGLCGMATLHKHSRLVPPGTPHTRTAASTCTRPWPLPGITTRKGSPSIPGKRWSRTVTSSLCFCGVLTPKIPRPFTTISPRPTGTVWTSTITAEPST